jgi:membrane protein
MIRFLKRTFSEWQRDNVSVLAAALAYYAVFSLAPVLIIVIAMLTFFGQGDAQTTIMQQIRNVAGEDAAQMVRSMIENRRAEGGNVLATVVGFALVAVGATGVVAQLRNALNIIFNVQLKPEKSGLRQTIWVRVKSLLLILGAGLLLLAALVGSAIMRAAATALSDQVPGTAQLLAVLDPVVVLVVSGLVFAMIYKFLPNVDVPWRTLAVGAAVTAALFVVGNWLLSFYLSRGAVAGAYGAAGALVVILLWVFVSAQILLLGAELTKVYAERTGNPVVPGERARERLPEARSPADPVPLKHRTEG